MVFRREWASRKPFIKTLFDCKEMIQSDKICVQLRKPSVALTLVHLGGMCQEWRLHQLAVVSRTARLAETVTGYRRVLSHIELSITSTRTRPHRHVETVTRVLVLHRTAACAPH